MTRTLESVVADLLRNRGTSMRYATVIDDSTIRMSGSNITKFIKIGTFPAAGTRIVVLVDGLNVLAFGESDVTPAILTDPPSSSTNTTTGATPKWETERLGVEAPLTSWSLLHIPLHDSLVLSLNGVVLQIEQDYSVADGVVTFLDPDDLWLGLTGVWHLHATYPYLNDVTVQPDPTTDVPDPTSGSFAPEWSYNGDAFLDGARVVLDPDTPSGSEAGSMVSTATIPDGWSTLTIAVNVELPVGASTGNGFALGLLDSAEAATYIGGSGSGLGVGFGVDPGGTPLDSSPDCAVAWVDTEPYYSGDGVGVYLGSRSGGTTTTDSDAGTFADDVVPNDYELTFTATSPGRASAVLKWNGTTILSSTTDLYVPATPRIIIAAGSGANHQYVYVNSATVTTDVAPVTPGTPPEPGTGGTPPPLVDPPPITSLLTWAPPSTSGAADYTVPAAPSGKIVLDNKKDWVIDCPVAVTKPLAFVGGRDITIIGLVRENPTTPPPLSSKYDGTHYGLRFYDGPNPNLERTIFVEGYLLREGYFSDGLQTQLRTENFVTLIVQNMRVHDDAIIWGSEAGVHADLIQFYGGPRVFLSDGVTGKNLTYQGAYLDVGDKRGLPAAGGPRWQVRRWNLEGSDITTGARYMLADRQPAFSRLVCEDVYTIGEGYDATGWGKWPSAGLTQNATPPGGDWVPFGLWTGDTYTSPGYEGV